MTVVFSGRRALLKIECTNKYCAMASMMRDSQCESRCVNSLAYSISCVCYKQKILYTMVE